MAEVKDNQTLPVAEPAAPQSAPPGPPSAPAKKPAGKGRKKLVKRLIALGVAAAILGGGGFALYRFLTNTDADIGEIFPATAQIGTIQSKVSGRGSARASRRADFSALILTKVGKSTGESSLALSEMARSTAQGTPLM